MALSGQKTLPYSNGRRCKKRSSKASCLPPICLAPMSEGGWEGPGPTCAGGHDLELLHQGAQQPPRLQLALAGLSPAADGWGRVEEA